MGFRATDGIHHTNSAWTDLNRGKYYTPVAGLTHFVPEKEFSGALPLATRLCVTRSLPFSEISNLRSRMAKHPVSCYGVLQQLFCDRLPTCTPGRTTRLLPVSRGSRIGDPRPPTTGRRPQTETA